MSARLALAEHFVSINGEGQRAGELALFLRFAGCNLCCEYCDTKWANAPSAATAMLSPAELCGLAVREGVRNVTLTGGEPLLQEGIGELISLLGQSGFRVEIETNGSIPLDEFAAIAERPSFTMDYKLACSGMESHMCTANFALLAMQDTVKFVVGSTADLGRAMALTEQYRLTERCMVYLSAVFGSITPAEIVEFMKERRCNDIRLQLQMHKYIWDPNARGV